MVDDFVQTILFSNANYIRQHSGTVIEDILMLPLKAVEDLPQNGRAYRQLPEFLVQKEAIINGNKEANRCFGFAVLSALNPKSNKHGPNRPGHSIDLFQQYGLDDIVYAVPIDVIPAMQDQLCVKNNFFHFLDDKGEGRHTLCLGVG